MAQFVDGLGDDVSFLAVARQVEKYKLCQSPVSARVDTLDISTTPGACRPGDQQYFQPTQEERLCAQNVPAKNLHTPEWLIFQRG